MNIVLLMNSSAPHPAFWNRIAPGYAKKPVANQAAYEATLDRVRFYLSKTDRVLELGCGTGSTALTLCDAAQEIEATDFSPEMIRIARDKAAAQGVTSVSFSVATLEDVAAKVGDGPRYDTIMAFNLLHLTADVPAALRMIFSLLRPGGHFVSKTPCVGDSNFIIRGIIPIMQKFGRAPFVHYVRAAELEADIGKVGFEVLETGYFPERSQSFFVACRKPDRRDV